MVQFKEVVHPQNLFPFPFNTITMAAVDLKHILNENSI